MTTYFCEHCGHKFHNAVTVNGMVWCPDCFKATPEARATVREPPQKPKPSNASTETLKEWFPWIRSEKP